MDILLNVVLIITSLWAGALVRDYAWRGRSRDGTRMLIGSEYYFVIREGDIEHVEKIMRWHNVEVKGDFYE